MKKLLALAAGVVMTGVSATALAAPIFINEGPPTGGQLGWRMDKAVYADDFTLSAPSALTGFTFWVSHLSSGSVDDIANRGIGWAVYKDNAGAVGTLIASGTDTAVTKTALTVEGHPYYYAVDGVFSGLGDLAAGTYWISLRNGPWGTTDRDADVSWLSDLFSSQDPSTQDKGYAPRSTYVGDGPFPTDPTFGYSETEFDLRFQINGNAAAVPEPATFALVGLALAGLAATRRKKLAA